MSVAKTYAAHVSGLGARIVTIEVDLSNGLHAFSIVGLGDRAIEESKDRVSAAIKNSGFLSPKQKNQKVVISLAPADMKKEGPVFDLGIALSYLLAAGEIYFNPEKKIFLGELSLEGNVRKISGVLPMVLAAQRFGFKEIYIPKENAKEAALVRSISIYPIGSLKEIVYALGRKMEGVDDPPVELKVQPPTLITEEVNIQSGSDFSHVRGQETAKRALEIAASGGHNIAMYGPPGTGKTMLANALASILPLLSHTESLEVTSIHSIARTLDKEVITYPPYRAPHHTSSYSSIVGGGNPFKLGEITLAHRGVLFLDELSEFDKRVIDALREPLESHSITIARIRGSATYPARCIFIAAMNPCACGQGKQNGCICTTSELLRYRKKISGPIADRIDLWIPVTKIKYDDFSKKSADTETSAVIRERVIACRLIQKRRFELGQDKQNHDYSRNHTYNSDMTSQDIEKIVSISQKGKILLGDAAKKMNLSGRAYHRVIKVAQTIADMEYVSTARLQKSEKVEISDTHILEALQYRRKEI